MPGTPEYSMGIMGTFAGKPGSAGRGAKICPACHRPIYAGEKFCRLDGADDYQHWDCFWAKYGAEEGTTDVG